MKDEKWYVSFGFHLTPQKMANWKILQQTIIEKEDKELNLQHSTTSTKLEIARYHLQNLALLVPTKSITDLTPVIRNEDNSLTIPILNLSKLLPFFTEYESFLFSLTSSIDSFLAEVNIICGLQISDEEVYIKKVRDEVRKKYGGDSEFAKYLCTFYDAKWFRYLGGLRNLVAHRVCSSVGTATDFKLYLPEIPKVIVPLSIIKYVDFFERLDELISETEKSIDLGFGYLLKIM